MTTQGGHVMTTSYFTGTHTVAEIKATYRELCFLHHPDRGGDTATMQDVNAAYHRALLRCDGQTSTGSDDVQHTYHYKEWIEQAVMDKLNDIIHAGMADVEIMLIGSWIWITGNTKAYAKVLGKDGLKCRWNNKRLAWYWHTPTGHRTRYSSNSSLEDIANTYGCATFASQQRTAIS